MVEGAAATGGPHTLWKALFRARHLPEISDKAGTAWNMVFGRATATVPQERRGSPRTQVSCAARLRTSFGAREGTLSDLSISGARFHSFDLPKEGSTALLEWETHDAMCRVVWARNGVCGLLFDRPIPRHVVDQSAPPSPSTEPPAEVGKIPLGQRSSLRAGLIRNPGND